MNDIVLNNEEQIENMIYEIRGKQVMLDSDLAKLYQVETKRINEAVKNNIEKFPERFSWKLTDNESKNFLVENFDQKNETRGGRYKNPRVFTEQGVAMLATILKSKIAIQVSIRIMDAFVKMRKYISNEILEQNRMLINHENRINILEETFKGFKAKNSEIYFNGQIYDAYSKILDIFSEAKDEIVIIDAYADKSILDIISKLKIEVILIVKVKSLLSNMDIEKYNMQYSNLKIIYTDEYHDRYFILDKKIVYHCGASINRIGYKTFSITLISDEDVTNSLIEKVNDLRGL